MASKVYFANLRARKEKQNKINRIQQLFEAAEFNKFITADELTAIKLHFGEKGCDAFINPIYVRQVVDRIKNNGGKPFVTDTNTLYSGSRYNSVDHITTAIEHGFDYAVINAPIIISDGLRSGNIKEVEVNKKHFKKVKIAADIFDADSMIVMSHFKGHEMAGFGGTIKNLAMGCAPAVGKKEQHALKPFVRENKCVACGACIKVCPEGAISLVNKIATIDKEKCIGCGECLTVCQLKAIQFDWMNDIEHFNERMVEYAYGAIKDKLGKVGFINFLTNITPDCDCCSWSDAPIVPDIGFLASTDPVALDKASLDLINNQQGFENSLLKCNHEKGADKFKGMRKDINGEVQLTYANEIGMGSLEYELIEI